MSRAISAALLAALAALAVLAVTYACVMQQVTPRFNAAAGYDDWLFMRHAMSIASGHWLGPYSSTTLVKGPGFPIWLSLVHALQIPVGMAAALTYAMACALVYIALRPVMPSRGWRLGSIVLLLSCPGALADFTLQRELIYPALVLLTVAAACGLVFRVMLLRVVEMSWAATLGVSAAMAYVTREEALWLVPLAVAMAGLLVLSPGKRMVAALAVTVLSAALPLAAVCAINRHHYGVFALVEFDSRPFTSAFGALTRVHHSGDLPHVPVPRRNWQDIASVSPAFAEIRDRLTGPLGSRWLGPGVTGVAAMIESDAQLRNWFALQLKLQIPPLQPGTGVVYLRQRYAQEPTFRASLERLFGGPRHAQAFIDGSMDTEIGAAWFPWVLREAVTEAGHYRNASDAAAFYKRLADEVNGACDDGRLRCWAARDTLLAPLQEAQIEAMPRAFALATETLVTSENLTTAAPLGHLGDLQTLRSASEFVHQTLAAPHAQTPELRPIEWLIEFWRAVLPWVAACATLASVWWLLWPLLWPRRQPMSPAEQASLLAQWLLLALVFMRLLMIAVVHATGWPAAMAIRYVAPAQPLLMLLVALVVHDLMRRSWPPRRAITPPLPKAPPTAPRKPAALQ